MIPQWAKSVLTFWFPITAIAGGAVAGGRLSQQISDLQDEMGEIKKADPQAIQTQQDRDDKTEAAFRTETEKSFTTINADLKAIEIDVAVIKSKVAPQETRRQP